MNLRGACVCVAFLWQTICRERRESNLNLEIHLRIAKTSEPDVLAGNDFKINYTQRHMLTYGI